MNRADDVFVRFAAYTAMAQRQGKAILLSFILPAAATSNQTSDTGSGVLCLVKNRRCVWVENGGAEDAFAYKEALAFLQLYQLMWVTPSHSLLG